MNLRRTAGAIAFLGTLSSPVEAGETQKVELSGISDNDLHDDLVLARGEVRGYEGLFVDDPDATPVAKHESPGDKFVYFDVLAEDGVSTVCLGVDHLLKESEGIWSIDTSTARINAPNEKCRDMLDAIPQAYEDVVDTPELVSLSSLSNWKDGIEVGFMMGPYMEEYDMYTRGINPDFRFIGYLPLGGSPWKLGATTNFYAAVDEMERKGLGRIGGSVAREFTFPKTENKLTLSVQGGWSKDYNPLLNAPYAGFAATLELARFDALNASLVSDVLVVHEFIGNEQLELAYTGSLGVVVHPGQFIDNDRERPVRTKPEAVIAFEPDEDDEAAETNVSLVNPSKSYWKKVYVEWYKGLDLDYELSQNPNTTQVAETLRLTGEIDKYLKKNNFEAAYRISLTLHELIYRENIELDQYAYKGMAFAARGVGDIAATYRLIKKAYEVDMKDGVEDDQDLKPWYEHIERSFAWVELEGELLEGPIPFAPDARSVLDQVNETFEEGEVYYGLFPVTQSPMTVDGQPFALSPISEGGQVTVVQP